MEEMTRRAERVMRDLVDDNGRGFYASRGLLFNHTVFGRDAAMAARWLMGASDEYRQAARDSILMLSRHQGIAKRRLSEEEPGRILNEYKNYRFWNAPGWLKLGNRILGIIWGGSWRHQLGYIGLDSTPLYVSLVSEYALEFGREILDVPVVRRDDNQVLVRQCLLEAVTWITDHTDDHGFVSCRRRNLFSYSFQSWRDTQLAYIHPDGHVASLSRPLVYLEVQIACVDALAAAAELLEDDAPKQAAAWRHRSTALAKLVVERFWLPQAGMFAMALEPDQHGHLHRLQTPASSQGWLLDSTVFNHLESARRRYFIEHIIRRLGSSEFMTAVGLRIRGNGCDAGLGVADYHGSWTVWPMDTYKYARGLRRQGFPGLAANLEQRIIDGVRKAGSFSEFFLVSPAGEVLWRPHDHPANRPSRQVNLQILPERDLTWTVAACYLISRDIGPRPMAGPRHTWRRDLEREVLSHLERQPPHRQASDHPFGVRQIRGVVKVTLKSARALARDYIWQR